MFSPWEGDVLTTWPRSHKFIFSVFRIRRFRKTNSPSWARTNNPSVNSRMLYHWAIEEYLKVIHTFKTTYSLYKYQSDYLTLTLPYFRKRISRKLRFLDTFAPQMYPYSHPQPEPLPCFVLFLSVRIRFLRVWISLRPISSSQLHALLHFHLCPIYLVFFKGSWDISSWGGLHA